MSPSDYERTEQGDDPSCPTRLTDEQLRETARSFTDRSIEAAAINEALALRAQAKELILEIGVRDGVINDLQARVTKLEAELEAGREDYRTLIDSYDAARDCAAVYRKQRDAALKAAPE